MHVWHVYKLLAYNLIARDPVNDLLHNLSLQAGEDQNFLVITEKAYAENVAFTSGSGLSNTEHHCWTHRPPWM